MITKSTILLIFFLFNLLHPATSTDAFTACTCLSTGECPPFTTHSLPSCHTLPLSPSCVSICCEACRTHGQTWAACDTARLKAICKMPSTSTTTAPTDEDFIEPSPTNDIDSELSPTPIMPADVDSVDLTLPAGGRPFPPAACACVRDGKMCARNLAGASGVCESGVEGGRQNEDCQFTCCRLCLVNSDVEYCKNKDVKKVCRENIGMVVRRMLG